MDQRLSDLLKLLELERLELNLFRGESRDIGSPQVFGGQVLGQALVAASHTIEDRIVHSLHAYFLRPGDFNAPIVYEVDRSRDGHSISSRRVIAIQHGQQIFNMAASFQVPEQGLEHQFAMPSVPGPEELHSSAAHRQETLQQYPEKMRRYFQLERPFEVRPVQDQDDPHLQSLEPMRQVWFRAVDRLPADQPLHRCLLAYLSDYLLLETAVMPHRASLLSGNVRLASIDHAMWFHHDVQVDDWLLYSTDSPSASGSRGLARGSIYARSGKLVASTAQEGLMRLIKKE